MPPFYVSSKLLGYDREATMVKLASNDVLAILRAFKKAGDEHVPRHIERLSVSHPSEFATVAQFKFGGRGFYIVIDTTAEDNEAYITEQIHAAHTDAQSGVLVANPNDDLMTYGLPFKGKDAYLFEVVSQRHRLDVALAELYPDTSRSTWQKRIKLGQVSVNGAPVLQPKHDIAATDTITVNVPDEESHDDKSLPIIYLDDNIIVIDKPAGVLTHSKGAINEEFTVADFFRRYSTYNRDTNRPGIIHRLDRDTSGVMIGARNPETASSLQRQFADRKAKKTYVAVVEGHPKEPKAVIDLPIGRNPSAPSTFRVDANGKAAQTSYQVIASNSTRSLIELRPTTGRTHQLRVHLAHLGTPIVGDRVYGKESDRLYLHAAELEITIPTSDRRVFTSPVPASFAGLVSDD